MVVRRTRRSGFTLLEVMCAFAILAIVVGILIQIFVSSMQQAATALSLRELHEAADTIFRKMIYQWQWYDDGDSKTLDVEYGDFARLPRLERERWARYRYVLSKKAKNVAGIADPTSDFEDLFEKDDKEERSRYYRTPPPTEGEAGAEKAPQAVALLQLTLKIFDTEADDGRREEPLLVLSTWVDPQGQELKERGP